jgi:hypothetical protein
MWSEICHVILKNKLRPSYTSKMEKNYALNGFVNKKQEEHGNEMWQKNLILRACISV